MSAIDAVVRTRSLRGGHFRAGCKHAAEPGDFPAGTFTEEQLARLRADPDLDVEVLEAPRKDPPAPKKKQPAEVAQDNPPPAETDAPAAADATAAGEAEFAFDDAPEAAAEAEAKGQGQ